MVTYNKCSMKMVFKGRITESNNPIYICYAIHKYTEMSYHIDIAVSTKRGSCGPQNPGQEIRPIKGLF